MSLPIKKMPCPQCNNQIDFDAYKLLQGEILVCTNCNAQIKIGEQNPVPAIKSNNNHSIPCPSCNKKLDFDPKSLLLG